MNHRELALQNWSLASLAPNPAWQIVVCFYAAVHTVNYACFGAQEATEAFRHPDRKKWITRNLPQVALPYRALEKMSLEARYYPSKHPFNEASAQRAQDLAKAVLRATGILGT